MRTLLLKISVLLGLCGAVAVFCVCGDDDLGSPEVEYTVSDTALDLSTAFLGVRDAEAEVVLSPTGAEGFTFNGFDLPNCPDEITYSPDSKIVHVGESVTVTFLFEPEKPFANDECKATPQLTGVRSPGALTITYEAREAICAAEPPEAILDYGGVESGDVVEDTLTLSNATTDEPDDGNSFRWEFGSAQGSPQDACDLFPLDADWGVIGPGGSQTGSTDIVVGFAPVEPGTFQCTRALVSTRGPDEGAPPLDQSCPEVITWKGVGTAGYTLSTSALALDTAFVGVRPAEAEVVLTAGDAAGLTFSGFVGTCPDAITWSPASSTLDAGQSDTLTFRFEPEEPFANDVCELTPQLSGVSSPAALSITYEAREAVCAWTPEDATLDYGEVGVGNGDEDTLTLSNATLDALVGNSFRYEFGDPSPDCDLFFLAAADSVGVIEAGGSDLGSKDIVVGFVPAAPGEFQCKRSLLSTRGPDEGSPALAQSCPTEITWSGVGVSASAPEWSACPAWRTTDWHGVFGLSGSEIYVAGDGGTVMQSMGSCHWTDSFNPFTDVNLRGIWAGTDGSSTNLWVAGNIPPPEGLFQETGAIEAWKPDSGWVYRDEDGRHTYSAVWGSALDDVYFVGTGISTDFPNAKHWDGSAFGTFNIDWGMSEVSGVSGTGANDIWAVLRQQFYSVYHFDGSQWTEQPLPFTNKKPLQDVWAVQGIDFYAVYAVGDSGAIYSYVEGRTPDEWMDESIKDEPRAFYGVWVSPTGQVFVVGEGHVIYRGHVKEPGVWTLQNPPSPLPAGDLLDVWGSAGDDVYAVGTSGLILHYGSGS